MELVSPAVPLVNELAQRRHLRLGIPFRSTSTRRTVLILLESLGRRFFLLRLNSPKNQILRLFDSLGTLHYALCMLLLYEEEKIVTTEKDGIYSKA